jgi:ribosome recycling factor
MTSAELKSKLDASLDHLKGELAQIRTGRVTPSILDDVKVNAYESMLTVREVGTITVVDSHTLQITPWDKNLLEPLEKAIKTSELGLSPSVNNDAVMVPVPALTEDRRKEFTRLVATKVEETKSAMRRARQLAMKDIDTGFTDKEFGEDEKFTKKEEVEDAVKDYISQTEKLGEKKKEDILSI